MYLYLIMRNVREIDKTNSLSKDDFIKRVFDEFGDGETLSRAGFERLILSLQRPIKNNHLEDNTQEKDEKSGTSQLCWSLNASNEVVTKSEYKELCPKLLYYMAFGGNDCKHDGKQNNHSHHHHHQQHSGSGTSASAWIYASVSVVLISLCGVLAVAVIPVMQKAVYHGLLQFLVALAVGTLCGDALLHLLPHAMMSSHIDFHGKETAEDNSETINQHEVNLWRGFVAALSVAFFYFTEKCLSLITEWKKKNQRKNKMNTIVRVMREDHGTDEESRVGEKLCKHKYSSYPYCYGEITNSTDGHQALADSEINNISRIREENGATKAACQDVESDTNKEEVPSYEKQLLEKATDSQVDYTTIILREHETHHHGHAHTHGHVHSAPGSMGNVAWMVIMGDGIHNFTDGLAIGAAFAANIGGGISTAVAVFCHELPHEIGDFAVLLKAGMSARQAVFYNLLSSLLCFIGMALGVVLGHNGDVKMWLFSGAAGMFLYIALVDMIPELTSSHSKEGGSLCQCLLQLFGLMSGIGIMLIIALYEEDLMTSFQHSL
ncbi:zinc transporter foi-like isoform X2 [Rhodnius prolixus]|uniref:zinc transporter foi-like isoform X2 n=1 Tax=Rhodnius prolixus TaxID=13249 RepID=UPI003D18B365